MKVLKSVFAAAAIALTAGCMSSFNENDTMMVDENLAQNVQLDDALSGKVRLTRINTRYTEDKFLGVIYHFRTMREECQDWLFKSYKPVQISYHFDWTSSSGAAVENPHPEDYIWQTVLVYPGEEFSCTSLAPSANADSFKLTICAGNPPEGAEVVAKDTGKISGVIGEELQKQELPEDVRKGEKTTTDNLKKKTDATSKKADELQTTMGNKDPELKKIADALRDANTDIKPAKTEAKPETQAKPAAQAKPATQAKPAKKCNCKKDCLCGCQDGEQCLCNDKAKVDATLK